MKVETDTKRRQKMEAEARALIGTLRPNVRRSFVGWFALIVSFLVGIAAIKSIVEQTVTDSWQDTLAFFVIIGFIIVFLRYAQLVSPILKFDAAGIRSRVWLFSAAKTYDWLSIISCEEIWLGAAYETCAGVSIKTGSGSDFDNTFFTAYSIFKNRYSLEE